MIETILQTIYQSVFLGPPVWVWPLLAGLVLLGLRASRTRTIKAVVFYLLPLTGLIAVNTALKLPNPELVWPTFTVAYIAGILLGYRLQPRWLLEKSGRTVTLAGEWVTMTVLMIIFWMNFAKGMVLAVAPDLYSSPVFLVAMVLLVSVASGTFTGRALNVVRAGRSAN